MQSFLQQLTLFAGAKQTSFQLELKALHATVSEGHCGLFSFEVHYFLGHACATQTTGGVGGWIVNLGRKPWEQQLLCAIFLHRRSGACGRVFSLFPNQLQMENLALDTAPRLPFCSP